MKRLQRDLQLAVIMFFFLSGLTAQYMGGDADGYTKTLIIQIDLTGIPVGAQPLYVGGNGDGFDNKVFEGSLSGQMVAIYKGGNGDGFDIAVSSLSLDGQELMGLYTGGDGDGFDQHISISTLDGMEVVGLYTGGHGDGFDLEQTTLSLDGVSVVGLYVGGDGDGFDSFTFASGLMGEMLALYGGGDGDGFDQSVASFTLNGAPLVGLYGGGAGDGFDVSQFSGAVPLPLTLITFEAIPEETFVLLRWVTEDELDTDFFTIEKTREGNDFTFVGEVDAAGFSEPGEQLHYNIRDEVPWDGSSFYRLKTTDFDGAIALSHLVAVNYTSGKLAEHRFELFPNPNTGKHFSLQLYGYRNDKMVYFNVLNASGRELLSGEFYPNEGAVQRFELPQKLSPGSYLIRLRSDDGIVETKILLVGR